LNSVSPADCKQECYSRDSWCVSFDYYKFTQKCDLSDRRARDVGGLRTNYPGNPFDHYSLVCSPSAAPSAAPSASPPTI
jgi:hypothetical protein